MNNEESNVGSIVATNEIMRQGYEASVVIRADGRAGAKAATGAKGIVTEVMVMDQNNLKDLGNHSVRTKFTANSTAKQVDLIKTDGKRVLERIQVKDTCSPSGVQKTLKQVSEGKYRQAKLVGTTECASSFNSKAEAKGVSKRMIDTHISTNTTTRIGSKMTNTPINVNGLLDAGKASAGGAVVLSTCVEAYKSLENGDSFSEFANHAVAKGTESAIAAGTTAMIAEGVASLSGIALASSAIPVAGPLAVGAITALAVAPVVGEVVEGCGAELGELTEEFVEDVGNSVSNIANDLYSDFSYYVGGMFWWL